MTNNHRLFWEGWEHSKHTQKVLDRQPRKSSTLDEAIHLTADES